MISLVNYKPLTLFFLIVTALTAITRETHSINIEYSLKLIYLFTEIFLIYGIGLLAKQAHQKIPKTLLIILFYACSLVYIIQIFSLYSAGGYLSSLAIANSQTAYTTNTKYTLVYFLIFTFIGIQWLESKNKKIPLKQKYYPLQSFPSLLLAQRAFTAYQAPTTSASKLVKARSDHL